MKNRKLVASCLLTCTLAIGLVTCGCRPTEPSSATPKSDAASESSVSAGGRDQPRAEFRASSAVGETSPAAPADKVTETTPPTETATKEMATADAHEAVPVSPQQITEAKELAEDLGVVLKTDSDGNVILLDTAAKRSWVDDAQLQEMLIFPTLQTLVVEGPNITHLLAPQIARLTSLTSLTMRNTLITNEGIAELKPLRSLKVIDLRLSPFVNDTALEHLLGMPELRAVRVSGVAITDDGIATLLKLPQLSELDVRNCRGITQTGIEELADKKTLNNLKIGGPGIDDQVLGVVSNMEQLTALSLGNCDISDAGLATLSHLPLTELTIYQCAKITDEGLHVLSSLPGLQQLTLRDVAAQGAALAELPHPEKFISLNMAQSGMTDTEVVLLERMVGLEEVTLSETNLTDAAVETLSEWTISA